MLALGIRYLTGYAVATDVSSRDQAEWPPHPARVYMAMAAAVFDTGGAEDERAVLRWLEEQAPPAICAGAATTRTVVTHYVPVNDSGSPVKGRKPLPALQSVALGRDRQPRTFPRVRLNQDTVTLMWADASPTEEQVAVLERVCRKVTRIGHSSSLVQMWVEQEPPACNIEPADFGEFRLRIVSPGALDYLASAYNGEAIEAYAELTEQIGSARGAAKKQLKQELLERFPSGEPISQRPAMSLWQAYRRVGTGAPESPPASGAFERDLLIFGLEGPVVGLESTWQLLTVLHKTILTTCDPAPEWLSGHRMDGTPSQQPHMALIPLAFVGREHADGHLMGVAIALPKGIALRERGAALRPMLYDSNGMPRVLELKAGRLGDWTLTRETRPTPPVTLRSTTWTAPSRRWATVTPIVLDRHPKTDRSKDRERWTIEVAEIIAESCERQGLPRPVVVDVDKTSWHRGAPRAVAGKGSGYPLMPVKDGQVKRQQVHAWLEFNRPVEGPLLLGAGRYRGYGLCRPWKGGS